MGSEMCIRDRSISSQNVVSLKALRSLTGKLQSIASLLYTWRPFVHMLYAAVHTPDTSGGCPKGCCWFRQIAIPVGWIRTFLAENPGDIRRIFTLSSYLRHGDLVSITTDASPFGIGAILETGGNIVAFFSDTFSVHDRLVLELAEVPSSSDQQLLESFAILVALRHLVPTVEWTTGATDSRY